MPRNKDLKRLVRTRMQKTGEAYTTALAQIVKKPRTARPSAAPDGTARKARKAADHAITLTAPGTSAAPAATASGGSSVTDPADFAKVAGMSDDVLKEKTGCNWQRWVAALDAHGAAKMSHAEIARIVTGKYKMGPWWGQMVTVGYERIRGLRARGQRRDGRYNAGKSRTYNVPVATLFDAWADASMRRRWMDGAKARVRTSNAPKSLRLGWEDGTIVSVGFVAKGASKSSVALEHEKLPDNATAERMKKYWSERLDALGELLAGD